MWCEVCVCLECRLCTVSTKSCCVYVIYGLRQAFVSQASTATPRRPRARAPHRTAHVSRLLSQSTAAVAWVPRCETTSGDDPRFLSIDTCTLREVEVQLPPPLPPPLWPATGLHATAVHRRRCLRRHEPRIPTHSGVAAGAGAGTDSGDRWPGAGAPAAGPVPAYRLPRALQRNLSGWCTVAPLTLRYSFNAIPIPNPNPNPKPCIVAQMAASSHLLHAGLGGLKVAGKSGGKRPRASSTGSQ